MTQLALFDPAMRPVAPPQTDLDLAFRDFKAEEPDLVDMWCESALAEWRAQVRDGRIKVRLSAKGITEALRARTRRHINNSFVSRLADEAMARHPELRRLFETRRRKS